MGDPSYTWILNPIYLLFLFNHRYYAIINRIPTNKSSGYTVDIIMLLIFRYWKPVYYKSDESNFPSFSTEKYV